MKTAVCFGFLLLLLTSASTQAAIKYWDSNGATAGAGATPTGTWGTSAFWSTAFDGTAATGAWTSGDDAVFSAGNDGTGTFTVTISGTQTAGNITHEEGTITISGGTALNIGGGVSGKGIINVASNTLTISSVIPAAGGDNMGRITKNGSGTLVLSGNNVFTNGTTYGITINGGVLSHNGESSGTAGAASTTGTIPATTIPNYIILNGPNCVLRGTRAGVGVTFLATAKGITLNGGGTLEVTDVTAGDLNIYNGVITGTGPLIKDAGGVLSVTAVSTYTGATIISNGTLRIRTTGTRLPVATDLQVWGAGIFDVANLGQTVATLSGNGSVTATTSTTPGLIVAGSGSSTYSGVMSGSGSLSHTGTGTLTLAGVNTYTGKFTNTAGAVTVNSGAALCGAVCDVVINGGTVNLNNAAQAIEDLTGTGGTINLGSGHTLTVNPVTATKTYSGTIAGPGGLTKTSTITEVLSGANTYTGPTTVSAGKLITTAASTGGGNYSAGASAILGIIATTPGAALNVGDLTLAGTSAVEFDFAGSGYPSAKMLNDTGNIAVNGTVSVNVKGFDSTGTATLLEYSGTRSGAGSFALGAVPPRVTAVITDDTINQKVIFTATALDTLRWVSDATGNWDANNAANTIWQLVTGGTATYYQEAAGQGDIVQFDDTATGVTTVNHTATLSPYRVTVDNSSKNYTFGGTGKISGIGSLIKNGSGGLTISTANDFTGGSTLNGGTIGVANNAALGTGKLTINGGVIASDSATARTLSLPVDLNGDVTFGNAVNNGNLTFSTGAWNILGGTRQMTVDTIGTTISSVIAGQGLSKAGAGTLTLTGANTFTGDVNVNAGVLAVTVANALGTTAGKTVVASGAALQTSTTAAIAENITLNGTGIGNAGALRNTANNKTLSGAITLASSGVRINCDANTLTLSGGITGSGTDLMIGGAGGVTVNTAPVNIGSGTLTWDGGLTLRLDTANTIGAFNYNSGIVKFNTDTAAGTGTITVGSAATEFSVTGGFFPVLANSIVLTAGANPQFYAASGGSLTLNGIISGPGAAQRRDTGAVNPVLNGSNTFAGGFLVTSRGVTLGNKSALGTSTFSIGEVATTPQNAISIAANTDLTSANAITNPVAVSQSFTLSGTNGLEFSGPVTLANVSPTITVSSSAAAIFSGNISGAGFGITKAGTGTLTLAGNNTYDGVTIVNAGTLRVSNPSGSGTGSGGVTVNAGGSLSGSGTVSGAVSLSGAIAPGSSVGTLTTGSETWSGGGSYKWELINVNGAAGTGWDLLSVNGGIDVQATSGNKFTIKVTALDGAGAVGALTNFDNNSTYTWGPIVTTTDSVTNFDASKFTVDYAAVSNDLAGGEFVIQPNSISVRFTNNHAPITTVASFARPKGVGIKIRVADLLASFTSDPDGDERVLYGVDDSSTNGVGNVSFDADFIHYSPGTNGNVADAISYSVRDNRTYRPGIDTVRSTSGTILITIAPDSGATNQTVVSMSNLPDNNKRITFAGIPGRQYLVQAADNLTPPIAWASISTNFAGTNGLWIVDDLDATNHVSRFYRTAQP